MTDLERPRYVGRYEVPEAGAHNFWVDEAAGLLYVGYYQEGIRVVDVTGELRGELYRQGREIAASSRRPTRRRPDSPTNHGLGGVPDVRGRLAVDGEVLYATDYNSGRWSFTVEMAEEPIS